MNYQGQHLGQQIFGNDPQTQVAMQNMMSILQQSMAQMMMNGNQNQQPDLQKFLANKVNDMNQFYSQIQQPNTEENQLKQSSQFITRQQNEYNPSKYLDDSTYQQMNSESVLANNDKTNRQLNFDNVQLNSNVQHFNEFVDAPIQQSNLYDKYKQKQNYKQEFEDDRPIKPMKSVPQEVSQFDHESQSKPKNKKKPIEVEEDFDYLNALVKPSTYEDDRPIKSANPNIYFGDEQQQQPKWEERPKRPVKKPQEPKAQINNFDEMPIKSNYKPFEDMVNEQVPIKKQQPKPKDDDEEQPQLGGAKKKTFLKKGTRQYLSNAQVRSEIAQKEQQEILKENNATLNATRQLPQQKPKDVQKYTETNLYPAAKAKKVEQPKKQSQPKIEEQPAYQFDDDEDWNEETDSKIAQKYFGVPKKEAPIKQQQQQIGELTTQQEEEIVRKYVQEKIDSLNAEIAKFKAENDRVRKSKIKYEDQLKQLNREKEEWEKQKENEKALLEEFKEEEKKKIMREKRVQERQQKTFQNMPNRKEREEIDMLKKQIEKMVEDGKAKEQKYKLNYDRMKKQGEDLQQRNNELTNEIKALELKLIEQKRPQTTQTAPMNTIKSNQNLKPVPTLSAKKQTPQIAQTAQPAYEMSKQKQADQIKKNVHYSNEYESDNNSDQQGSEGEDRQESYGSDQEDYEDIKCQSEQKQKTQTSQQQSHSLKPQQQPPKTQKQQQQSKYDLVELQDAGMQFTIKHINKLINETEFQYDCNRFFQSYKRNKDQQSKVANQTVGPDGKIQRVYANGKKEVIFHNGVKREVFPDGYTIVHFTNHDIKQTLPNGTIIYYFADASTTQITINNGPNIYRFANHQIEIHFPDGSKEIRFGDGTEKLISPKGEEETIFSDGIFQRIDANKTKFIEYPNGNIDIVYPDGQKVRQAKAK